MYESVRRHPGSQQFTKSHNYELKALKDFKKLKQNNRNAHTWIMLSAVVSISSASTCSATGGGEAGWGAGGGGAIATCLFLPLLPFTGAAAVSVTIWAPPTSLVVTLRGSVSPLGSRTTLEFTLALFCRRFWEDGLIATVLCWDIGAGARGGGAGVAAWTVTGEVKMAWLVPGMIWICPPWGIIWMVWDPWNWGITWYWMLALDVPAGREGLWIVKTMGLAPDEPSPAGSWMTFPFAERKPRFLGGAGAIGAGLMGCRRRVVGWDCGVLTGAWAAGGPILLQVAARSASGEGCESYKWACQYTITRSKLLVYNKHETKGEKNNNISLCVEKETKRH